jgi:hypothetical protein
VPAGFPLGTADIVVVNAANGQASLPFPFRVVSPRDPPTATRDGGDVSPITFDGWIRSLAYDRVTQCLEVRFKWKAVTQFRPVSLSLVRQIWKARPMNVALEKLVFKNRRIRFDDVRTEGKLLASLLRGWDMIGITGAGDKEEAFHG